MSCNYVHFSRNPVTGFYFNENEYHPPHWKGGKYTDETNHGLCACGRQFEVSDQYHFHCGGICHNRYECVEL